jgi:hypothetical protein
MKTSRNWPLAFATLLALAACESDSDGPADDGLSEIAAVYCPKLFECCAADELAEKFEGADPPVNDVAACERYYQGLGILVEAILRDGRAEYDPDRLSACLDDLDGWDCDQLRRTEPFGDRLCDLIVGQVQPGDYCDSDMECADGAYCEDETCRTVPGPGDACSSRCTDGLYCKITDGGNLCVETKPDGEACQYENTCTSGACNEGVCGPREECTAGLFHVVCGPCQE